MIKRVMVALAVAALALAPVSSAFAAKSYESSRSNVSKKPGMILTTPGVTLALAGPGGATLTQTTNEKGEAAFANVRAGRYTLTISSLASAQGVIDGVMALGPSMVCIDADQQRPGTLTVMLEMRGAAQPLSINLLGLSAADAAATTTPPATPPARPQP